MTLAISPVPPVRVFTRRVGATAPVTMYGSRWSAESFVLRLYLARSGVATDYVEVDRTSGDCCARTISVPSVYVDGEWLHRPEVRELRNALVRHGFIEHQTSM